MAKLAYDESIKLLEELEVRAIVEEKVFLSDTLGRVLSRDIVAQEDLPLAP